MLAAGGEAPAAGQAIAALHRRDLAHRHIGRGDQHAGVVAPHVLRGAVVEQRQLPVVDGHHTKHPRRRHAAFGQGHLHLEEVLRLQLVAVPARRLEDAEEPRLVEIADGFLGQLATRGGSWRAFAQYRHQLTGALAQALTDQVLVEHLLFSCDRSPAGACADSSNARAGRHPSNGPCRA
ncbi:hypothetical protein D3C78_1267320 [compost metagenome]